MASTTAAGPSGIATPGSASQARCAGGPQRLRPCRDLVRRALGGQAARIACLAAVALGVFALPAHAEGGRVAVVDVQHAVMQTEDGIRAQATLKKFFDQRQQALDAKQAELAQIYDDIEKQQALLSRESFQKRTEDWQRGMLELQTKFVNYNKELQKKQAELTGPIIKKMITIIGRVANQRGYEVIIDKQAAPYARPDLDLTDQIVQMYNSGDTGDPGGGDGKDKDKKDEGKKPE